MQIKKEGANKKFPLSGFEVALLVILLPIIFYYLEKFLWTFGESENLAHRLSWLLNFLGYLLDDPWSPWGPLSILGFNCLWVIMIILCPLKKPRIKIYTTLLIFTISAALLTMWIVGNSLRNMMD